MDEYYRIKKQLLISELLVKYKNQDCTQEEHEQVVEFMKTSLKSFVKSRLSEKEVELASIYISDLEMNEQLKEYINSQQEMYDHLSIYEAYVLFEAKERLYYLEQRKLNEKNRSEQIKRVASLKNSLIRDYGHKF